MTESSEVRVELDDNILERIADLICGDDGPKYRTGRDLTAFFENAGWRRVGEVEGGRWQWTFSLLKQRRRSSADLRGILLRLADPREYIDEEEVHAQVVQRLNQLLAIEGYQILDAGGRPELINQPPTAKRPAMRAPIQLTARLDAIVSDQEFGRQLKARLDEAHACWKSGACIAAIIMLGSTLEGVLYDVALARHTSGKAPTDHLESLIDSASRRGWIAQDIVDYVHVLRNHRNLVHPKKQFTQGYAPKDDTVLIAWNVVVAALNDLQQLVSNTLEDQPRPEPTL